VPYTGIFPIELTLDHVGPMARTVADCALMLVDDERFRRGDYHTESLPELAGTRRPPVSADTRR
jgi:Asp-tRNA(Asn)/Glu-tRNA(Gln) amidotransferase A subunit family amidase